MQYGAPICRKFATSMRPVILIALLLTGCASTAKEYAGSGQQFDQDAAFCEFEGEKSRSGGGYDAMIGGIYYTESFNRVFDACMRMKGYAHRR